MTEADRKIVFDKFHVAQHLGQAVDEVRRKENKALQAKGDKQLVGTRYDWLRNPHHDGPQGPASVYPPTRQQPEDGPRLGLEGNRHVSLYDYIYQGPARKHFQWWHGWAVRSRLAPMIAVAGMLKRRFENIITNLKHRITNAASESINAKIQWVKYTARGFRNKQNYINAIYFHCGGLDLAPAATK